MIAALMVNDYSEDDGGDSGELFSLSNASDCCGDGR
jgi:hypothetical protein